MAKYLLVKGRNNALICITILPFLLHTNLIPAQTYTITFKNTTVSDALLQTSKQFDIKVAFDSKKLTSVYIDRTVTGSTIDDFMNNLLRNSGYNFIYKYNRYLIVEKKVENDKTIINDCQIIGSVTDSETGEQLPYASVLFIDRHFFTPASENGSFSIRNVSANPAHLMVSYIGYTPVDTTISWTDPMVKCNFRLERKLNVLDSIVVHGNRFEMIDLRNDVDLATTIDPSKLIDLPVLAETDIFRMLQLLPGISYAENSSGLTIRGGSSDQNLVLFDGQTLYNLSHYYGVVSALNPNVIKDLQVYKGGYDSRFGERVSGIVDISGKSGNKFKPTVYGDLNLLSGNITAEIPVNKKLTIITAARRSYSDIYATSFSNNLFERGMGILSGDSSNIVNQTRPSFYFYDYNAKLTYRTSDIENFSLSFYGGKDFFRNSYSGMSQNLFVDETDKNVWSNYGISATWMKQWNESFYSNLQIGTSGYSNKSSSLTTIDRSNSPVNNNNFLPDSVNNFGTYNMNNLKDIYMSMRNTYKFSNDNQLNFGFLTRKNTILYHKDADEIYVYDNTKQEEETLSAYVQDRITLFRNLIFKPGIRLSYYSGKQNLYFEPRFSANYKFSDAFSLRMATGRYYQFLNQVLAQQETGYNKKLLGYGR